MNFHLKVSLKASMLKKLLCLVFIINAALSSMESTEKLKLKLADQEFIEQTKNGSPFDWKQYVDIPKTKYRDEPAHIGISPDGRKVIALCSLFCADKNPKRPHDTLWNCSILKRFEIEKNRKEQITCDDGHNDHVYAPIGEENAMQKVRSRDQNYYYYFNITDEYYAIAVDNSGNLIATVDSLEEENNILRVYNLLKKTCRKFILPSTFPRPYACYFDKESSRVVVYGKKPERREFCWQTFTYKEEGEIGDQCIFSLRKSKKIK